MRRACGLGNAQRGSARHLSVGIGAVAVCLSGFVTKLHAQPAEPPPAAPPVVTTPAPAPETQTPPAAPPPPPSATEIAPPASPQLEPIQPSFPTPAPAAVPEAQPIAAAPAADPLAGNVSFRPFKGVEVKSNDGNWSLSLKLKGQIMDEFAMPTNEDLASRNYFFVRRMRIAIGGSIFTKDIKYKTEFTFAGQELNRRTAGVSGAMPAPMTATPATSVEVLQQAPLLDMFIEFQQLRDLTLHIGQAKVPFGRERYLSDEALQTVDRSVDDAEFNFDRDMGIELRSTDLGGLGMFRYYLGIYAAEDKNAGNNTLGVGDFGYLYFARFEVLPMGKFEDTPVDFARTSPKLSFGLAYAFVQTDATSPYAVQSLGAAQSSMGRPATIVDYNFHNLTADFLFKAAGFSALGAFHYRKLADLPNNVFGRDGIGLVLQLHYLFSKDVPLAIALNGSTVRAIGDDSTIQERSEIGGGLGYYFFEHGLKLEAEFEHLWRDNDQPERAPMLTAPLVQPDNRLRLQLSFII
jgi:phosphate-selective porin OprO and OprP